MMAASSGILVKAPASWGRYMYRSLSSNLQFSGLHNHQLLRVCMYIKYYIKLKELVVPSSYECFEDLKCLKLKVENYI